jgi:hypothetical protein
MRKIKFTDIAGMLERDEMREISGGSGNGNYSWGYNSSCAAVYCTGGSGISNSVASAAAMGFGGGSAIGSSFGGQTYAGYNNSIINNSNSATTNSYSSANYSSNNYSSGWSNTAGGLTTNDPKAISRYFDFVYANNGVVTNAQTNAFIINEGTVAGQQANNVAYAIQLNPVTVVNNYHGPSTIPQGIVIDNNGFLQVNNIGATAQNSGGSSNAIYLPQGVPPTDCVFQCMAQIGALYGDSSLNFTAMKANYDTIYKAAIASGSVAPALNGVNEILFSNFVDQYFNRADVTTSQLDSFISAGGDNFAIGVIRKYSADGCTSSLHAVILTKTENNGYA